MVNFIKKAAKGMFLALMLTMLLSGQEPRSKESNTEAWEKELDSFLDNMNSTEDRGAMSNLGGGEMSQRVVPDVLKPIEGWGELQLGLSMDEVKSVLSNRYPWMILRPMDDPEKAFAGQVYFLETFKNDFFSKVQFQFDLNERLYLLRVEMNPRYFSFIRLYERLTVTYGPAQENTYTRVTWKDGLRFLELYRNNTIVYLDKTAWEALPNSQIEDQRKKLINTVFDDL